jgi:hypothetical protein
MHRGSGNVTLTEGNTARIGRTNRMMTEKFPYCDFLPRSGDKRQNARMLAFGIPELEQ